MNECNDDNQCEETECDTCNRVIENDVICRACGEHSELREHTGTDCCGSVSRF
jgi:hypothetical protein